MTTYIEIGNSTFKVAKPPAFTVERYVDAVSLLAAVRGPVVVASTGPAQAIIDRLPGARVIDRSDFAPFVAGSYDAPETLGLDRILNLAGLDRDGVVVSCGTAITVDAVVAGRPRWGAILPGFRTAAEGLHARVPILPVADLDADPHLPARSTAEAIAAGILLGTLAAVRGLIDALGVDAPVVLTGGDAPRMARIWGASAPPIDDALLFRGMMLVVRQSSAAIQDGEPPLTLHSRP